MKTIYKFIRHGLWVCLFIFIECEEPKQRSLSIDIVHVVRGEKLEFEDKLYTTEFGHGYNVYRLKYYISDLVLKNSDGSTHVMDTIQLIDASNEDTHQFFIKLIPAGSYTNLSFVFGINEIRNFEGNLENNIKNNNMEWPVIGEKGYHYMKFEGKYDSMQSGIMKNFNLHTGPTENNKNYVNISLSISDSMNRTSNLKLDMIMDLDKLLHGPNRYNFEEFGQGIMSNQKAQEILKQNAKDVFKIVHR